MHRLLGSNNPCQTLCFSKAGIALLYVTRAINVYKAYSKDTRGTDMSLVFVPPDLLAYAFARYCPMLPYHQTPYSMSKATSLGSCVFLA